MKQVVAKLSALCLSMVAGCAAANCVTDTTQANFQAGVATNVDLTTSSGNVVLAQNGSGGTLDQQNTSITGNGELFSNTQWNSQTFTANASGALTRVDLNLFCYLCQGTPPPITISIRAASGGLPTGSDLATASAPINTGGVPSAIYTFNFAAPATVSRGTQYAIVVRSSASYTTGTLAFTNSAISGTQGNDVYSGGVLAFSTNSGSTWSVQTYGTSPTSDGGFKTYVSTGASGYVSAGDLVSSAKDSAPTSGTTPNWNTISWTDSVPNGTNLKFQVAASNSSGGPFTFVGPDRTSGSYFTASGADLSQFNGNRYLKYRAYLASSSSTATPTLNDATVCYTNTSASADLSVTVDDGVTTAVPGGSVTYSIVAHNAGPSSVSSATVTDTFPAALSCNWTCQGGAGSCGSGTGSISSQLNLPAGASVTYTATCSIAANASGTLTDTASISSGVTDPATGNNTDSDSDTLAASTNVAVTMTDQVDRVRIGDVVDYTINVTNSSAPSNANVTVTDTLPTQLTSGSWVCTPHNGATCGGNSGSGNLNDSPSLPTGSSVTYLYTATVVSGNSQGMVDNAVTVKVNGGGNQASANISATDSDVLIIFAASFESGGKSMTTAIGGGSASSTIQLGGDSGLMNQAPAVPITVATGLAPTGQRLFSVQLVRFGGATLLRTLTTIDDSAFSDVSPWQAIRPGQPLSLQWQSATARGDDGFLSIGALLSANNAREPLTQLQIAVEQTIPWLVPIEP